MQKVSQVVYCVGALKRWLASVEFMVIAVLGKPLCFKATEVQKLSVYDLCISSNSISSVTRADTYIVRTNNIDMHTSLGRPITS